MQLGCRLHRGWVHVVAWDNPLVCPLRQLLRILIKTIICACWDLLDGIDLVSDAVLRNIQINNLFPGGNIEQARVNLFICRVYWQIFIDLLPEESQLVVVEPLDE